MSLGWLPTLLSLLLNVLVIYFIVRNGFYKKYLAPALFCLVQIAILGVSTVIEFTFSRDVYAATYWTGDLVAHLFITLVIVNLVRIAVATDDKKRLLPYGLFLAMLLIGGYSMFTFYNPHLSRWMNPVSRNLSVGEETLNLILWTFLLQKRDYDLQLVIISAGIGIQVTGEVIGLTLRPYTNAATIWVPNLLAQACEFLCLLIWLWAFYHKPDTPATEASAT